MLNKRAFATLCMMLVMALVCFTGFSAEAASPWYYSVTGPGGSNEIPPDQIGQKIYFEFDATAPDYVWGNVRIDFDPTLLECLTIEETPDPSGFWTAWVTATADPAYGGGGSLYYYDSTGQGTEWAEYWVSQYGPLGAGPSGSYDNALGIIRLYVMTYAGGRYGSVPLRIRFLVKQAGTAVFNTYANDWTAFGWPSAFSANQGAVNSLQAASAGQGFSWNLADLPFRYTSVVNIVSPECIQPPSGLVSWWPGDGNADDSIDSNHGTLIDGATFAAGKVGQAFSFDGVDDRVEVPSSNSLNITGPLTIDTWFNLAAPLSSMTSPIVAKWGDTQYGSAGYGLFVMGPGWGLPGPDNKAGFFVSSSGGDITLVYAPDSLPFNEWHHLAGVYDGAGIKLYIDGVMVAEKAYSSGINVTRAPLLMGSYNPDYTSFRGPLAGLLDEVEIFNRALSGDEIKTIYLAGSAGKCKNAQPTANAGPDQTVEMTSCAGASVTLDGSASSDPDGDTLTYTWIENGTIIATGVNPTVALSYGSHTITLTVDDGKGGTASDDVIINVVDTIAPALTVSLNPNVLWPPNHKYVTVTPAIIVTDACAETVTVQRLSASSSEPDNGLGDGDTANDIVTNADGTISLRAERSGTGSGRVYTVTYQAVDIGGNATTASATVTVPHNK